MNLSPRLTAVANLVTSGYKIADIGTDHAYIPIFLLKQKKIPYALAMDIHQGPLKIAKENVKEAGLANAIEVRQSNGLMNLKPYEVETIVVAGLGGHLMIDILLGNWETTQSLKECVLQPQSEIKKLRTFLVSQGFTFIEEDMVEDAGKYYFLMKVSSPSKIKTASHTDLVYNKCDDADLVHGRCNDADLAHNKWSDAELKFGKLLLETKNPTLKRFLLKEFTIKENILKEIENETGEHIRKRQEEILDEMELIREGLSRFERVKEV